MHDAKNGIIVRQTIPAILVIARQVAENAAADLVTLRLDVDRLGDNDVAALGDVDHDIELIDTLLGRSWFNQSKRRKKGDAEYTPPPALAAYLEECEAAMHRIHADFFSTWAALQRPEWRAKLALVRRTLPVCARRE